MAALLVLFVVSRREQQTSASAHPPALSPSSISTGAGEGSRLTFGDVVLDVGADTRAEIRQVGDGATVLDLERGSVDCDVEPRPGRAPFRVRAGSVTVTVVGTRFTVWTRSGEVRVEVARGKVAVTAPSTQILLQAGESWSSSGSAAAASPPSAPATEEAKATPAGGEPGAAHPRLSGGERTASARNEASFARAQRLERSAPDEAARLYRELAAGRDTWAALATYSLADLRLGRGQRAEARKLLDEYERRFPGGANAEEIAWLRIQVAKASNERRAVEAAASAYLGRYPSGAYAARARRILEEKDLER
jgi:hypothetical protein